MASVRQKASSEHWFACFKIPTGRVDAKGRAVFRRVQRSTGTTDKTRAEQLAISYERAAVLASEKRWVEQSARNFLAEINAIAGLRVAEVEPVDAFFARWLKAKRRGVAPKTWKNVDGIVATFLEWLGPRKLAPLLDVSPRVMTDYRDAQLDAGKAGTTVNKDLAILGQAFDEAVATGVMEKNPARGLRVKGADKKAQKRRAFTFDQFRELVRRTAPGELSRRGNEVHADWQTFVLCTGYTGGRQQETAQLPWHHVDFGRKLVGLVRTKNGDVHWVPMHGALETHLRERWVAAGQPTNGPVMPHIARLPERKVSRYFRETILPRVGISQPYEKPSDEKGVGRKLAEYSVHSLRHSLSTWLNAAGVSEMMRMRIVGHEDEDVSRGYTHTELEQAAAELAKVPSAVAV